jgi:hypothetical protein
MGEDASRDRMSGANAKGGRGMKFDMATMTSLALALLCVLGGLFIVPWLAGSNETPWPQAGVLIGWVTFRLGRALRHRPPPPA